MQKFDRERRRKFGQNFLNNPSLIRAIAADLPALSGEHVVEIGPGHGALTRALLDRDLSVVAFDIDSECVDLLNGEFADRSFAARHQNFLDVNLDEFTDRGIWLAGNLPYNVGTAIVTKVLPELHRFRAGMFMLQLEVIERMAAVPGTKAYNSLSVFCQAHATVKLLRKVDPENFTPKPNVMSATALFSPLPKSAVPPAEFFDFVQLAFTQKRKTLQNNLGDKYSKAKVVEALEKCSLPIASRAEEIEIVTLIQIWKLLQEMSADAS